MKRKLATLAVIVGAMSLPITGFSMDSDSDRSSPKAFVKDSVITAKIKAKFAADEQVSALHIRVDTDNKGVVTLSGKAKTRAEANQAVSIAQHVEGVARVEDHIQIVANR